jgi:hypothetical protein
LDWSQFGNTFRCKNWQGCNYWSWSIVTKNIPPYSIAIGVPAQVVKYRFNDEIVKHIEEMKWWDWSIEKIKKNQDLFFERITQKLDLMIKLP